MTLRILFAGLVTALGLMAPGALAQEGRFSAPGDGPLDISADDLEVFDQQNRVVYSGDVNAVRGTSRLRADRMELFFEPIEGPGFGPLIRMVASGSVFYVTPTEVARADGGTYDVQADTITMIGNVVLTQGCNVSTGERLVANLESGTAELTGSSGETSGRVRSVFFPEDSDSGAAGSTAGDCEQPAVPGDGPRPYQG